MNNGLLAKVALALTATAFAVPARAADVDVPRTITADTTWTADNTYFLSGYTFVVSPAILTIQPGTVIKGRPKAGGSEAAALVITRGARIMAAGTAAQPIIFTAEADELDGLLGPDDTQLWGGLVVLGNATINSRADNATPASPVVDQIEGFAVTGGEVDFITFGGTDDADNSGVLRYVSIRHGGEVLGTANEINGLSLGGVGSGTVIDHIEVFANKDDGIELFGGTVDLKNVVMAFGKDDGLDFDQGWRGRVQFLCVIGGADTTESQDKGGEWDGATAPLDATPMGGSSGIFNATMVGNGTGGISNTALNLRDNLTAKVYNSIFVDYNNMIDIEDDAVVVGGVNTVATTARIDFANNVWWSHTSANNTPAGLNARTTGINAAFTEAFFTSFGNTIADPMLKGISRTADAGLDLRPDTGSPALGGVTTVPAGGFYTQTTYKGAFAPEGPTWLQGWTKLSRDGYLTNFSGLDQEFANISTRCMVGTGDDVAIAGFVVTGTEQKVVLIRGVGPGLDDTFGLTGVLADPVVTLQRLNGNAYTTVASNDDWGLAPNATEIVPTTSAVGAFALTVDSLDAVLLISLPPGQYTAIVSGKSGSTGRALIEVYGVE